MKAEVNKQISLNYHKRRFYTNAELEYHNTANDIWVCFFNDVYNLSNLVQTYRSSPDVEPIIKAAGTDITSWFDDKTREPRKFVNSQGVQEFYLPQGKFLNLEMVGNLLEIPWWKNQEYFIGKLTKKSQKVRIINTLSNTQDLLEVPNEQNLWEILARYEEINCHAKSYTWKRKGKILNMDATLTENDIKDETQIYEQMEVPLQQQYIPAIHIHFNDDLTSK